MQGSTKVIYKRRERERERETTRCEREIVVSDQLFIFAMKRAIL
jgi:hypothetical protein